MLFKNIVSLLKKTAASTDAEFYIVGGAVRDYLLGIEDVSNLDITVIGGFENFTSILFAEFKIPEKNVKMSLFKTAVAELDGFTVDIVTARKEFYRDEGMLPEITPSNLEDDIRRRDFTINSIAYDVRKDKVIDFLGGADDLSKRILRANRSSLFTEDPTRIFRFIKYRRRFSLIPDNETFNQFDEALNKDTLFENVSKSRISKEWLLLLKENSVDFLIDDLNRSGVFKSIFKKEILCSPLPEKIKDPLLSTLAVFYQNDTPVLIKVADTLLNGIKKNKIEMIEKMKSKSGKFEIPSD
ncbi:MAG: hypothetical protein AB7T10_08830 [bacterium]